LFFVEDISSTMQIQLNGEAYELPDMTTLAGLLAARGVNPLYTAVEVNRELVPRARHTALVLQQADRVEVVTLVGGG
jgi:sulfur carrier protein